MLVLLSSRKLALLLISTELLGWQMVTGLFPIGLTSTRGPLECVVLWEKLRLVKDRGLTLWFLLRELSSNVSFLAPSITSLNDSLP